MKKHYIIPLFILFVALGIRNITAQTFDNFQYLPIIQSKIRPAVASFQAAYASDCAHAPANETDPPATFPNDVAKLALRATLDGARGAAGKVVWIVEDVPVYEFGFDVENDREMIVSEYYGQPAQCGIPLRPATYRVQLFANDTFLYEGQIVITQ